MSSVDFIIDANQDVEDAFDIVCEGLKFKNKTLDEWSGELTFPLLSPGMGYGDLQVANCRYVELSELVMANYAIAKSVFDYSSMSYNNALKKKTSSMLEAIRQDATKRVPGFDTLEKTASLDCINQYTSLKVSEIFLDFWKTYYEKLNLLDSRLSNLNFLYKAKV